VVSWLVGVVTAWDHAESGSRNEDAMLLVNSPLGYTVCLECHEIDRAGSREWAATHSNHADERGQSGLHPVARGRAAMRALFTATFRSPVA
jgi:hypothetical protein